MTILVCCPSCECLAQIPHDSAGKSVCCTGCQGRFVVPHGAADLTIEWGPIGAGRRLPLAPGHTISIGRTKENTVGLPGALVSRRHATLKWSTDEWRLRDAGSTNGTFVNGQRVRDLGLTDGSRIVIGEFALRLGVVSSGPSDLDRALDAMVLGEAKAGMMAVVGPQDAPSAGADSRADTAFGQVPLDGPDEADVSPRLRRRSLLERWPVAAALAILVIIVVVLVISRWVR